MEQEAHDLCPKTGANHVVGVEGTTVRCVDCGFVYPEGEFRDQVLELDRQRAGLAAKKRRAVLGLTIALVPAGQAPEPGNLSVMTFAELDLDGLRLEDVPRLLEEAARERTTAAAETFVRSYLKD